MCIVMWPCVISENASTALYAGIVLAKTTRVCMKTDKTCVWVCVYSRQSARESNLILNTSVQEHFSMLHCYTPCCTMKRLFLTMVQNAILCDNILLHATLHRHTLLYGYQHSYILFIAMCNIMPSFAQIYQNTLRLYYTISCLMHNTSPDLAKQCHTKAAHNTKSNWIHFWIYAIFMLFMLHYGM